MSLAHKRNTLRNLLHAQERHLLENDYDRVRAQRRVAEVETERADIESGIAKIRASIAEVDAEIKRLYDEGAI